VWLQSPPNATRYKNAGVKWVADARRAKVEWDGCDQPLGLTLREMVVAAALTELLASRDGKAAPPRGTSSIGAQVEPLFLDPGHESMPRTRELARRAGPEPLRRRNLYAPPDFLDLRLSQLRSCAVSSLPARTAIAKSEK
jgi:hypothetical protein